MKIMPDFGTVRENEAAFEVAVAAITRGDIAWGCAILITAMNVFLLYQQLLA